MIFNRQPLNISYNSLPFIAHLKDRKAPASLDKNTYYKEILVAQKELQAQCSKIESMIEPLLINDSDQGSNSSKLVQDGCNKSTVNLSGGPADGNGNNMIKTSLQSLLRKKILAMANNSTSSSPAPLQRTATMSIQQLM